MIVGVLFAPVLALIRPGRCLAVRAGLSGEEFTKATEEPVEYVRNVERAWRLT